MPWIAILLLVGVIRLIYAGLMPSPKSSNRAPQRAVSAAKNHAVVPFKGLMKLVSLLLFALLLYGIYQMSYTETSIGRMVLMCVVSAVLLQRVLAWVWT